MMGSWWWEQICRSFAGGFLASLTWAGLVWMSPLLPVQGRGWLQGMTLVLAANTLVWLGLSLAQVSVIGVWIGVLLGVNSAVGYAMTHLKMARIPVLWSVGLHPMGISGMMILLGGATNQFSSLP